MYSHGGIRRIKNAFTIKTASFWGWKLCNWAVNHLQGLGHSEHGFLWVLLAKGTFKQRHQMFCFRCSLRGCPFGKNGCPSIDRRQEVSMQWALILTFAARTPATYGGWCLTSESCIAYISVKDNSPEHGRNGRTHVEIVNRSWVLVVHDGVLMDGSCCLCWSQEWRVGGSDVFIFVGVFTCLGFKVMDFCFSS